METKTAKQNPLLFYLWMLVYTLIALALRLIALAPLAALVLDGVPAWAAGLCPVLWIFVLLPLRFSFGDAMAQRGSGFELRRAFSLRDYGEKLSQSLLHALHVAKWGLPLAAMGVLAWHWYNDVDAMTVLETVSAMGSFSVGAVYAVANVFGAQMTVPANTLMEGVFTVLAIAGLGVAVWGLGVVRNSATRYIWSIAQREERKTAVEVRRRLRGRRWAQLALGLFNLALLVPFWYLSAARLIDALGDLSTQLMMAIATGAGLSVDWQSALLPIVLYFVLLYLPLVPVRRWLTAAFAVRESGQKAQAAPEA